MKRFIITFLLSTIVLLSGRAQQTMNDLNPLPPGYTFSYDHTVEAWYADREDYYYVYYWVGFTIDTPMRIEVDLSDSKYLSHLYLTLMDRNYNVIHEQTPIFNLEPPYRQYSHWLLPGTYIIKCDITRRYALKGTYAPDGLLHFRMKAGFVDTALEPEPLPEAAPYRSLMEPEFSERDTVSHHTYINVQTMLSAHNDSSVTVRSCYDGLGREIKTIQQKITPNGNDLQTSQEHDATGRVYKKWLPQTTGWNDEDNRPYEFMYHESVPLESSLAHFGAGEAWNNAPVSSDAFINNTTERLSCPYYLVRKDSLHYGGVYATGDLNVTRTIDEDSLVRYDFTDKAEQLVLSRQVDGNNMYDTHYVYDTERNLRFVLPPAISTGDISSESLNRYAYQYKYNSWGKCIWKKIPGCDSITYAYDAAEKLIYSQDGNQRKSGQYTFYLYDSMGREVVKGICTYPDLQVLSYLKYTSKPVTDGGVLGSGYSQEGMQMTPVKLLTVNYYDNYDFLILPAFAAKKTTLTYVTTPGYDEKYINNDHSEISERGLLTGTCVYTLGEGDADKPLLTTMYYDSKGRIVQSRTIDHRGGADLNCFHYTFTGKALKQLHVREESKSRTYKEISDYTYDSAERLVQVKHQLNDGEITLLSTNEYDELCRLKKRVLNNSKQSLEYTYNIRNWMTGINSPVFNQQLHYTDGSGIPYYNGNISSMTWKYGNELVSRGYQFTYDGLSRLQTAAYGEGNDLSANRTRFDERITRCDKMGNIVGLKRFGQISSNGYGMIDDLSMMYDGNQLKAVQDSAAHSAYANGFEFKDNVRLPVEYYYDANGNLTQDLNKKIVDIQYNCLNLPCRIEFEDGSSISYLYDTAGKKLRTVHCIEGNTTTTDYCGNVIYENGTPKTLLTEGGFVLLDDNKYHYYLQDHQGNNRIVVDQDGNVEEVNHYYPFGGIMESSASIQPYKYNGKELDRKNGLDWYDYGARQYDAALGRWHAVDPMAEEFYHWSPYHYCFNNPTKFIDKDGKFPIILVPIVKGVAGGIMDLGVQVALGMAQGNSFSTSFGNVDWTSVGASTLSSAVGAVGSSTAVKLAAQTAIVAADAAVDYSINEGVERSTLLGGDKSVVKSVVDAGASVLPGVGSDKAIGSFKKAISTDLSSKGAATLTKETKSAMKDALKAVDNKGFRNGVDALNTTVGSTIGDIGKKMIEDSEDRK